MRRTRVIAFGAMLTLTLHRRLRKMLLEQNMNNCQIFFLFLMYNAGNREPAEACPAPPYSSFTPYANSLPFAP
jgi:hypothetical protein